MEFKIENAKYIKYFPEDIPIIEVLFDNELLYVPQEAGNRHYVEIMKQVKAGTLTIEPAEEPIDQSI